MAKMNKKCGKCRTLKAFDEYSKDRSKEDGLCTVCKQCRVEYRKKYYAANRSIALEYNKKWENENRQRVRERHKKWREENRSRHLASRNAYHDQKYHKDEKYRMSHVARSFLTRTLKALGKEKDFVTFNKIGYTANDLVARIEMNFQPGMSWSNYGEWEIDHRVPISRMIRNGERRINVLNCLANLKPEWMEYNRAKGNRWIG